MRNGYETPPTMAPNLAIDYNLELRQTAFELIKTLPTNSFRFFREIDEFITEEKRLLNASGHTRSAVYDQAEYLMQSANGQRYQALDEQLHAIKRQIIYSPRVCTRSMLALIDLFNRFSAQIDDLSLDEVAPQLKHYQAQFTKLNV